MTLSGQNDYIDKMMADARVRHETVKKLLKVKDYNMLQRTIGMESLCIWSSGKFSSDED